MAFSALLLTWEMCFSSLQILGYHLRACERTLMYLFNLCFLKEDSHASLFFQTFFSFWEKVSFCKWKTCFKCPYTKACQRKPRRKTWRKLCPPLFNFFWIYFQESESVAANPEFFFLGVIYKKYIKFIKTKWDFKNFWRKIYKIKGKFLKFWKTRG